MQSTHPTSPNAVVTGVLMAVVVILIAPSRSFAQG